MRVQRGLRPTKNETQLLVNFVEKEGKGKIVTLAVTEKKVGKITEKKTEKKAEMKSEKKSDKSDAICTCNIKPKETVVEENGNVEIQRKEAKKPNDCLIPDVAQV